MLLELILVNILLLVYICVGMVSLVLGSYTLYYVVKYFDVSTGVCSGKTIKRGCAK